MDRLVHTALSGLRRSAFAQAVTANNLANASTVGFRRDTGAFQSRFMQGPTFDTRVQASEQLLAAQLEPGTLTATGNPLDVAMDGGAMLAVQAPDGAEAYTRRGDLRVAPSGVLETGDGRPVLGNAGPITLPPAARVEIGADGTISYQPQGDPAAPLQPIDRLKLVQFDPATMGKGKDGLFRRGDGAETDADPQARVSAGSLESSNVSPVAAMVELIEQSRAFELETKLIATARDLDQSTAALMRLE